MLDKEDKVDYTKEVIDEDYSNSVLSKLAARRKKMSATEQTEDHEKPAELQWDDPELRESQPVYVDAETDPYAFKLPPDNQDYRVKITLAKRKDDAPNPWPTKDKKTGEIYCATMVELTFVAPGEWFDGRRVSMDNLSGYLSSRKEPDGASKLLYVLRLAGATIPPSVTPLELADIVRVTFGGSEPIVGARLQWTASSRAVDEANQNEDDPNHAKYSSNYYRGGTFLSGMTRFAKNDKGEYVPEAEDPITGEVVRARFKLVKFQKA